MKKLSLFSMALVAVLLGLSSTAQAQTSLELYWTSGPFIDFKNNSAIDHDARLRLMDDNTLRLEDANLQLTQSAEISGDLRFLSTGTNSDWLFHTPDNGSGIMYLGHDNKGTTGWKWDYQFRQTHMYAKAISIGTGTLPSGYKLAVDGKIMAEEVHVQNSSYWPDFVFADDYALQDLSSVNAFIQENRHLPGVPSAAEVEENGYDLGEMNKILLQKIEELTLHTIRQEETMQAQQQQIEALQAQVANK